MLEVDVEALNDEDIPELPPIDFNDFNLRTCQRCGLCSTRKNVVPPKIVPNCEILFIAEAPGNEEDIYGTEPLIGESGKLLNQILANVGIDRSQCSIANVVQCHPPKNRPPEKAEIAACYDILEHYIKLANPKVIVVLGNVALQRIAKTSGITKKNALVLEHKNYPNVKIVPVVHPSFALRDPKNIVLLEQGLRRARALIEGTDSSKKTNVTYVDTYEKFNGMMQDLESRQVFAVDIETSELRNWIDGHIICIAFSNAAGKSYVLPWVIGDEEYYNICRTQALSTNKRDAIPNVIKFAETMRVKPPKFHWYNTDVKERLSGLLKDTRYIKVLHNYAYDYKWLEKAGLKIYGTIYDTMIMHFILDETRGSHGLDDCCLRFCSEYGEYWKGLDRYLKPQDSYAIIPMEDLVQYAGTDTDITIQLFNIFYPRLMQEDSAFMPLLNGFLMPLSQMLMETEKNGVMVDQQYLNKIDGILTAEIAKIDVQLSQHAPDVNFNSTKQLRHLLFTTLRLPRIKTTMKGIESTDEEVLKSLQNMHDVPKLLLTRRKLAKVLGTYVEGMRGFLWLDGKVHPNFLLTGTETGRLSCNSPNNQNLPRNPQKGDLLFDLGVNIRDLFVVSDDDYVIVETDYSQAELRLIAEYSRDVNLYNAFAQGRDPHSELAVRLYHPTRVPEMEAGMLKAETIVTKEQRQRAKTANFSLVYGKSPENFATENEMPLNDAIYIHKVYWETYRGIAFWKTQVLAEAYQKGYFTSFFGRRRRMQKLRSNDKRFRAEAEREGINFIIQSQASDYTLYSTLKVMDQCKVQSLRCRTISFVHDSAVYEVHKSDLQAFLGLLRENMIHPPGVSITMECEVKVGTRLGSLKEWVKGDNNLWNEKPAKAA